MSLLEEQNSGLQEIIDGLKAMRPDMERLASIVERDDELLDALVDLHNVADKSLDFRPEFRRAVAKAFVVIDRARNRR